MRKFLLLIFASLISTWLIGQTTVTLGTGTSTNSSSGYPCPYANYYKNCRTQYLVTAAELTALGVTSSNITALAFNVSALNGVSALPNFSIKLKATTATVLTTTFDNTGLSEVFLTPSLTVTTGWNTHAFTTPFFWDGTSNVLIDICYSLTTSYTNNPSVYYTATTALTSAYYKNDTYVACGTTSAATTSSNRANMQITYQAVSGPLPPSNLVTTVINDSQINLGWTKNAAANNVMVAYNTTNTFGTPVSGTAYTAGQSISGGGTVIYNGSDVAFNHTGLSAGTTYYYKAWSVDGSVAYSNGISASATTMFAAPYTQNFESGLTLPLGWGGTMSVIANHGTSASNGLTYELWSSATSGNATTPCFGNIPSTCFLEFDYRIVNWSSYPATATTLGATDKIEIQISTDNGATYTTIYTINQSNHVTSTSFATKSIDLSAYAGQNVKLKYLLTWGAGDYYVDVDNFHVYVPSPMVYVSSTAAQVTGILPQGATNQLIIGLQVVTSGSLTPLPISSFTFNTNGTTNVSDIVNAKLWSSGTNSSPSSATIIGDVILNPSGIMTFDTGTGLPITLANGNNYFWLTYDVSPSAIPGDVLDAECNSFIFGGISEIPTIQAPAGNRLVRTPLSGIYTIDNTLPTGGTNYASFDDAVNELDILGVNGAVTFNVTAGQTFNVTCGASPYNYAYAITKSGTAANPIIFQKYGTGDNPIVNITGTSATNDIGFFLYGCDYVTFDGIKVMDAGTTSSNYLERGFYLQGPADNNCNNVTIKNCIVDLAKTNTSSNGFYSYSYAPASLANANSNNKFLNNTVQDCYNGYYFSGNSTYPDNGNEIGTVSGGTSTITNIANYGIYYTYQTGLKIYGNAINNISSSSGAVYGIYESSGSTNTVDIYSNTISALSSTSSYAYGIYITTGTTHNVYSNTLFDISSSISDAYGFAISSGTNTIYKNKIYNVRYTGTSTYTASGLAISGGLLNNVYNNYIFDIKAASSTSSPGTKGMNISGGTADNVFYNTVYLDYTSAVASNSSAALYVSSPTTLDLRNNIFVNNSLMTTGTRAVAFYKSSSGFGIISANTNNNLYYAGTPGTKNLIYYDGTNSYQTLDAYIAAISTKDQQAKTENVPFVSTTSPYDLHVNTAVATQAESGGMQVTTPFAVANDFDGDIRWGETGYTGSGSSTDIGADEFNGIIMDLTPPSIVYTALTGTTSTSNRTLTNVIITDILSGINTAPGTKPRIYFKKSTDNNAYVGNTSADNGWKWVEATGNSSPFNFVIDYSKLNGGLVAANDVIQYFVIAQDLATTPNVGINTGSFAAKPASVDLTATAFPIGGTPFSYGILTSIAGNISVGTGQTITSLTANGATGLFYVLNNSVVTGNLTVSVVSDLTETGATALNQWVEEGAGNYTLTIQPSDATTKT
ncbi:MAG TPA: BNR-repeat neuraminidase N-terminal domain-containing protein, partial [Bacteroidales bacterium]|nr:BNR-repeat neuraminidase N-terminal domain-containing protein [Bacteroidales bacterium]